MFTFIIGINSDILCPLDEQRFMEEHMPNATLVAIDSLYGHDGFIIEAVQITSRSNNEIYKGLGLLSPLVKSINNVFSSYFDYTSLLFRLRDILFLLIQEF